MDMVFGLDMKEILDIKQKLDILGINLKDLCNYMDRSEIQLFAEMKCEIKRLEKKLHDVRVAAA